MIEPETLNFDSLVAAIERTHSALAEQARKAVNISLTLRNWFIGYHIAEFELQGADRASYGDKLFAELSRALRDQSCQQYRATPALWLPGLLSHLSPDSAGTVRTICTDRISHAAGRESADTVRTMPGCPDAGRG